MAGGFALTWSQQGWGIVRGAKTGGRGALRLWLWDGRMRAERLSFVVSHISERRNCPEIWGTRDSFGANSVRSRFPAGMPERKARAKAKPNSGGGGGG